MMELCRAAPVALLGIFSFALVTRAATVEAGVSVEIRLRQEINSNSTQAGSSFEGVVIAPLIADAGKADGKVCIPAGTIAKGIVEHVRRVGLGLIRERASIGLRVNELLLPDGRTLRVASQLMELENAREAVDKNGRIQGIRSTNTPGFRATGVLVSLTSVEPIAMLFSSAAFATILRFSEPEIRLPPGTELRIRLTERLDTGAGFDMDRPSVAQDLDDRLKLMRLVKRLPYRTKTANNTDGDLTNLVFIGDLEAISRAFDAAGWHVPETINAASRYRTLRAVAESQAYHEAPMSVLLLNGDLPVLNRAKSLNSFARRHHIRIFNTRDTWQGERVTTAAATRDSGIGFSVKKRGFVHLIDSLIDRERTKVFEDLMFTGCVASSEIIGRPWVPNDDRNGTGDRLLSDGSVMVIRINGCSDPRRADEQVAPSPGPYRVNAVSRAGRRFFLTARNDIVRGNVIYQGVTFSIAGAKLLTKRPGKANPDIETVPDDALPEPRPTVLASDVQASSSRGGNCLALISKRPPRPESSPNRWVAPRMELGFHAGNLNYGSQSAGAEGLIISRRFANGVRQQATVMAGNTVRPGWQIGGTLTVNSQKWISHELGYQYQRGTYELDLTSSDAGTQRRLDANLADQRVGLLTRQLSYSTLVQLRPRESRWSPYVAVGPALQLMHLTDAPFRKAQGVFRLGLSNVGMIRAAYGFGHAPPLEGGGIFQPAVQFGGGIKARVAPRWTFRMDFRNTVGPHPDFVTKSLVTEPGTLEPGGPARVEAITGLKRGTLSQRRVSSGFSFTF